MSKIRIEMERSEADDVMRGIGLLQLEAKRVAKLAESVGLTDAKKAAESRYARLEDLKQLFL